MYITFAFMSAIFAGITAILSKIGLKNTDSDVATALRTIVVLIFSIIIVFITGVGGTIVDVSPKTFVFLILSGLATGASWLCYFKALQLGDVNKVTPIDKSSTILSMLFAFVILGEEVTIIKVVSMILIAVGTVLMITKKQSDKKEKNPKWFIYAIFSAVFAALTSILGKIGIEGVDSNLGTAIRTVVVLVMAFLVVLVKGKQKEIKTIDKKSLFFIIISGFATGGSWLCYYRALSLGDAAIVVPIDKMSIVLTVLFATIILKEKMKLKEVFGLIVLVGGTLLLLV